MIHRKSPIEHTVKSHTRRTESGARIKITKYVRGDGEAPKETQRLSGKRLGNKTQGSSPYKVKIEYSNGSTERKEVNTENYTGALRMGIGLARNNVIRAITLQR